MTKKKALVIIAAAAAGAAAAYHVGKAVYYKKAFLDGRRVESLKGDYYVNSFLVIATSRLSLDQIDLVEAMVPGVIDHIDFTEDGTTISFILPKPRSKKFLDKLGDDMLSVLEFISFAGCESTEEEENAVSVSSDSIFDCDEEAEA